MTKRSTMPAAKPLVRLLSVILVALAALPSSHATGSTQSPVEQREVGYPSFVSPHTSPIAISEQRVFVANTPADTLDVIDVATRDIIARVNVGIDPVSLAVRPDGKELWVAIYPRGDA